jgi:HSP20 family molecular chaperone IbpA
MNPFNDDPFGEDPFDIFREFFGERPTKRYKRQFIQGEEDERVIDLIETDKKAYFIFELPGFDEEDLSVEVIGNSIEIIAKKKNLSEVKDYLANKLKPVVRYKRNLPSFISTKKFSYTQKNGILEVVFNKK